MLCSFILSIRQTVRIFNFFLHRQSVSMREAKVANTGLQLGNSRVCRLLYADTILLSESESELQSMLSKTNEEHLERFKRRGPDSFREEICCYENKAALAFCSSVLHLRGDHIVSQPCKDEEGNLLLWNGEIFEDQKQEIREEESDTESLSSSLSSHNDVADFLNLFGRIHGPWAFIYWQLSQLVCQFTFPDVELTNSMSGNVELTTVDFISAVIDYITFIIKKTYMITLVVICTPNLSTWSALSLCQKLVEKGLLWFGRDVFGRRSLLYCAPQDPDLCFTLSSLALNTATWKEVPADGIYCLDVSRSKTEGLPVIIKYGWSKSASGRTLGSSECTLGENVPCKIIISDLVIESPIKSSLNTLIPDSFSEHACSVKNSSFSEIAGGELFQLLLQDAAIHTLVNEFEAHLSNAVKSRVMNQPFLCKDCLTNSVVLQKNSFHHSEHSSHKIERTICNHSSVGVLFSGGIDSLVIAALVHRFVPLLMPVDLMNVAFQCAKPKINLKSAQKKRNDSNYEVPDRITGKQGVEALKNMYPSRQWNFIEVNVNQEELEKIRSQHICHILKPSYTVLDDSIGCACWFAARGKGLLSTNEGHQEYTSPTRVLLLGMGADEQLAGYSRHRAKFCSSGWQGVTEELALEIDRISSRNLGRDDRIISDHGREARFPFLDEKVVSFLNEKPIWLKANLNYPRGIGDKLLLRLLAYKIGLKEAAVLPKRAIQFGSRIARSENNREKGSDHCHRLLPAV